LIARDHLGEAAVVESLASPVAVNNNLRKRRTGFIRAGTPRGISGVVSRLRTGMIDPPLMDPAFAGIAEIPSWPRKRASIGTVRF